MRRWVSFFFPIYQRVHWICLFFFFFNSLIFFTFFFFSPSRFGSEMCLREKHGRDLLVGRGGEPGMKVTKWH